MSSFFPFQYDLIHNPAVVDLLVSLACASAMEGQLKEELPTGIGLRVCVWRRGVK